MWKGFFLNVHKVDYKKFFLKFLFQKLYGRTEIALSFPKSVSLLFLYIGVTLAIFSSSEKTLFCIDNLEIWSNSLCKERKQCLTTLKLIPS